MKYGDLTLGQMEAVVNKLGGMTGVFDFLSGELIVRKAKYHLEVWKTIKLGLRKSPKEYRDALKSGNYEVRLFPVGFVLDNLSVSQEVIEVDLVLLTARILGFQREVPQDVFYNSVLELGLQKCPDEVGPALREQYPDQPKDECILIGMESTDPLNVLYVGHTGSTLWLANWSNRDDLCPVYFKWVFVRPRK